MKTPRSLLPDLPTLTNWLTAGLDAAASEGRPVRILKRTLPHFMSTFPNEIITCQLHDGRRRRVFIKYGAGRSHDCFGHRGDIPYEAEVYRRVLRGLPDFRPKCLGAHTNPETGDTTLFLEYAYGCTRLSDISWKRSQRQPRTMVRAAQWLARFHTFHRPRANDPTLSFLKRYEAEYYRGWAQRTFDFARPLQSRFPWLMELRDTQDAWFAPLLTAPRTVIHGEFYSKTVLVRYPVLFMVDWESAAIAPGEIDLAALIDGEGWPTKLVRQCEESYWRTRWPEGAPAEFKKTLAAAQVYLQFRWLGDRPDWTVREKTVWRYDHLRAAARRLGLIRPRFV
jgi:hypothetical protein